MPRSWTLARSRSRRSPAGSNRARRSSEPPPAAPGVAVRRLQALPARRPPRAVPSTPAKGVQSTTVLGEILTAVVTPFKADGSVDLDRFRELARHLIDNGSDGLVVTGTTGESPTLSDDERLALYAAAVEEVGDRSTVVAGTGTYSTAHSIHLTERAAELGVDGFLIVTPYYSKPPPRGIVEHFRAIASATDRPLMIYNIPARVVIDIGPETMAELAAI